MELTEFKDSGYFSVYCSRREPIEKRQQKGKNKQTNKRGHKDVLSECCQWLFRVLTILFLNCISLNTLR